MAHLILVLLALAIFGGASVVAALFILDKFTRFRGTVRLLHVFEPWGFKREQIPDLTGKTFIVTGANSGLGYGTALELAQHGADVIIAVRSVKKGEEAKKAMGNVKGTLTVMELDNNSLKSVKRFANAFKALGRPLNGLILNAGIMVPPFGLTEDGIESQFGVNHLAHFALTKDLLPLLQQSQPSTIVSVSSLAHWFTVKGGVFSDLAQINDQTKYEPVTWYGQSKLANVLFVKELTRRLGSDSRIYANAVHPGAVQGRDAALTVLSPAVSPVVLKDNIRGKYFVPIGRLDNGSSSANDPKLAQRVWEMSENILREKGWDNM